MKNNPKSNPNLKGNRMNQGGSLVEEVLERNREQSAIFRSPAAYMARKYYRALHPTEILWFKCMDGRLHGPVITETPVGIIQPFRNLAGTFDLGWGYLADLFLQWVTYAVDRGRRCLPFITYHWSKSDVHKGCKGHGYDVGKAKTEAGVLVRSIERAFGRDHQVVYPIMVGIETDEDAMVLHGVSNQMFNLADELDTPIDELKEKLRLLYPDMHTQMVIDLFALVEGNIRHIRFLRANPRPIEQTMHGEQIIAIGRGFDWLHWQNRALIIGPFPYDVAGPIETAANIVLENIQKGLVPQEDGALLMTSGVYRQPTGPESIMAEDKASSLERFALSVIQKRVPDLYPHLHVLSGTVDMGTRLFTPLKIK
ncbi:MAG: hypothetical protein WCV69_04085 [Patescibacteria group bacterium]|jgi:hypothetical protein